MRSWGRGVRVSLETVSLNAVSLLAVSLRGASLASMAAPGRVPDCWREAWPAWASGVRGPGDPAPESGRFAPVPAVFAPTGGRSGKSSWTVRYEERTVCARVEPSVAWGGRFAPDSPNPALWIRNLRQRSDGPWHRADGPCRFPWDLLAARTFRTFLAETGILARFSSGLRAAEPLALQDAQGDGEDSENRSAVFGQAGARTAAG